jgi:hypothetical protein
VIIQQPTVSQPDQPGREDLRDLVQALVGRHEIGRHRIAARKAVIETVGSDAGVLVQLAAIASYVASL